MAQTHTFALPPRGPEQGSLVELQQSIPSQISAIAPFIEQLMRFIRNLRKPDGSEVDIELALQEALANAVIHGNHEDAHKRVTVICRCSIHGEVSITIRDEGQGFNNGAVPDPTVSENRLSTHGRGVYLMQSLMDEVSFEEAGAVVHLRKKANSGPASPGNNKK